MTVPVFRRILLLTGIACTLLIAGMLYRNSDHLSTDRKSTTTDSSASESQLQELINARKLEHWDQWATEYPLTMPPASQPVHTMPEWEPVGTVLLALDRDILGSFGLNVRLHLASHGPQILANDAAIIDYAIAACNQLRLTVCSDSNRLMQELSFAHTFLTTISALAQHTNVLVVLPADNNSEDLLQGLSAVIREFPEGPELLNNKNVGFAQLHTATKWIRDYGPIFVQGSDHRIFLVDSRYSESLEEQRQKEMVYSLLVKQGDQNGSPQNESDQSVNSSLDQDSDRRFDDISPSYLAKHLRQKEGNGVSANPVSAVRPPLELDGGDFATDGAGIGFSSTQTLMKNGGNLDLLDQVFREYFGLTDIVYLEPLPGSTIKHIDMFFKVVSPDTLLLGTFESADSDEDSGKALQTEAQRVLNYDLEILTSFYSNRGAKVNVVRRDDDQLKTAGSNESVVNIILVPMPDVQRVKERVAALDKQLAELATEARSLGRFGKSKSAVNENRTNFKEKLAEKKILTEQFPQGYDIYRTYLNALQVNTSQENLLLLPSYKNLDAMDRRVQQIFRRAYERSYGNTSVIRVESDNLIELAGSIHCLTQTIPRAISVFCDDWNFRATPSVR